MASFLAAVPSTTCLVEMQQMMHAQHLALCTKHVSRLICVILRAFALVCVYAFYAEANPLPRLGGRGEGAAGRLLGGKGESCTAAVGGGPWRHLAGGLDLEQEGGWGGRWSKVWLGWV